MKITAVRGNTNKACLTKSNDQIQFCGYKNLDKIGKNARDSIKIVFSDIDGTISKSSDYLTKQTIDAINGLHERKIPVVLTTARCYLDTLPIIDQFAHNPDYTIVMQGGGLVDKTGEYLFENSISKKSAKGLIKWFKNLRRQDKNSHLILYFNDQPYSTSNIQFPWKSKTPIKKVSALEELFNKQMKLKKAVIFKTDAKQHPYNQQATIDSFNSAKINSLDIKPSGASLLEFQNKWVSKDIAIDFLLKALKIKPENAMVIGDSANDIEMFDYIRKHNGLAVAMGNAEDFVKEHANALTNNVDENGFANAINKLFSI